MRQPGDATYVGGAAVHNHCGTMPCVRSHQAPGATTTMAGGGRCIHDGTDRNDSAELTAERTEVPVPVRMLLSWLVEVDGGDTEACGGGGAGRRPYTTKVQAKPQKSPMPAHNSQYIMLPGTPSRPPTGAGVGPVLSSSSSQSLSSRSFCPRPRSFCPFPFSLLQGHSLPGLPPGSRGVRSLGSGVGPGVGTDVGPGVVACLNTCAAPLLACPVGCLLKYIVCPSAKL